MAEVGSSESQTVQPTESRDSAWRRFWKSALKGLGSANSGVPGGATLSTPLQELRSSQSSSNTSGSGEGPKAA